MPAAWSPAARCSKNWASIMSVRSTGMTSMALVEVLENVRDAEDGPILIHAVTQKGKGYGPAESSADKYHGVVKFDVVSGKQDKGPGGGPPSYTDVFADALMAEMARDEKVVAITAAMPSGTGLDKVEAAFPDRTFDVGIAEQHAVTFAAGLAAQGHRRSARSIRPSCSAPTTRWSTTSRSRICRSVSRWTAPAWSVPTAAPTPAASTSPISAPCRTSW